MRVATWYRKHFGFVKVGHSRFGQPETERTRPVETSGDVGRLRVVDELRAVGYPGSTLLQPALPYRPLQALPPHRHPEVTPLVGRPPALAGQAGVAAATTIPEWR